MTAPQHGLLEATTAEIEAHVAAAGWDRPPLLFALVRAAQLAADDPATAERLGLDAASDDALVPIEQEPLPDGPLDEVLAQIAWPAEVAGCALAQEIMVLPPSAEDEVDEAGGAADLAAAAAHPERRDARLVVGVLRESPGTAAALLRLRGRDGEDDSDLLTGPDLAPNLAEALHATLAAD
ncbi:PPA1309 family protein [Jatrophihabitans cynanchi]|uniref:PPA1309 family protein n=1 Tax=Jatrophihabitans cynanchi TaxID=2944128 RepID=A0ABY7JUI7_9ACTN|nr:PPA1309 family protein [Jatrophihabitans sp. SB3-54]WAX56198.1 PPA1309 family protein [Jatrophihabitans sp. SB3-54]